MSETSDPLDTPLPCDIALGSCTFRQGVSLRTFVEAAKRWREQARRSTLTEMGEIAELGSFVPSCSPEATDSES